MARSLLSAFVLLATGFAAAAEPELHVVAVYDGHDAPRDRSQPGKAAVTVNRPGKEVVLVVSAYEPVTWEVTATPKTKLTKVILGGYKRQNWKVPFGVVPDEMSVENQRNRILPLSLYADYKIDSPRFRLFIRACHEYTGLEIASFQGAYRADPKMPFAVDAVQKDERLSSDFPILTPASELPKFNFRATSLVARERGGLGDPAFGDFTEAGPKAGSFTPLSAKLFQVAYDPNAKRYYGITGHELHSVNVKDGTSALVVPAVGVRPNWLRSLTFDAKRDRVLITGRNAFYEYTPKNGNWQVLIANSKGSFSAIAWQKSTDTLFAVGKNERELKDREAPVLYELNADATVAKKTVLGSPMFPAVMDGGADDRAELIDLGGNLAAIIYREARDSGSGRRGKPETFLYVIDPKSGKVQLAWKE
jgi:hypothetical protein